MSETPSLSTFSPWKLSQPEDGIAYLYRSANDGFWRVINDEDMALQEATGYPVGELVEYEAMGDAEESEAGELVAVYLPTPDDNGETPLIADGGRETTDAERLANAEPAHAPADAPRDANGDPIFETTETLISEAPGDVCRTLGDSMRMEAVQLVAGAAARTDGRLTLCALANQLAGCAAVEETDVELLKQTLHHNHLPALHRANALHYDGEENIIETTLETASYARLAEFVTGFVEGEQ